MRVEIPGTVAGISGVPGDGRIAPKFDDSNLFSGRCSSNMLYVLVA